MLSRTADLARLIADAADTLDRLRNELLGMRCAGGFWCGELSASALSTATAVSALAALVRAGSSQCGDVGPLIERGLAYLDTQQNADGGYGDTDRSHSNIATSYLVLAARTLASSIGYGRCDDERMDRLRKSIAAAGALQGLRDRYGTDKTFVVPIMTNLAIAGLVDWSRVPRLPFEAAVFPGSMYRFLRMPVVSYAIPALVAIGQAHHFLGPRPWRPLHAVRSTAVAPTLKVLQRMQPESGGYLEATPLTSFVLMSLAASGRGDHPVARRCSEFLAASMREDGSWPIDTNLATWVTSLAIHALASDPRDDGRWATEELITWHLSCQHAQRHPFTGAEPGGWGWTDLSGAVPDGDDTPAAILAIDHYVKRAKKDVRQTASAASERGLRWLVNLQNRDGGMPTFCRGWGKLPFDRSSTDLTAHFIRAIDATNREAIGGDPALHPIAPPLARDLARARHRALTFLRRQQRPDGCWVPLWFGNQDDEDEENAIYGTGRALLAVAGEPSMIAQVDRAVAFLLGEQNADGGWGGGPSRAAWLRQAGFEPAADRAQTGRGAVVSSLEESAVALEGLVAVLRARWSLQPAGDRSARIENGASPRDAQCREAIIRGVSFLAQSVAAEVHHEPWPIGFYFAKLWYHERLYPIVLTMAALGAALELFSPSASPVGQVRVVSKQ